MQRRPRAFGHNDDQAAKFVDCLGLAVGASLGASQINALIAARSLQTRGREAVPRHRPTSTNHVEPTALRTAMPDGLDPTTSAGTRPP